MNPSPPPATLRAIAKPLFFSKQSLTINVEEIIIKPSPRPVERILYYKIVDYIREDKEKNIYIYWTLKKIHFI